MNQRRRDHERRRLARGGRGQLGRRRTPAARSPSPTSSPTPLRSTSTVPGRALSGVGGHRERRRGRPSRTASSPCSPVTTTPGSRRTRSTRSVRPSCTGSIGLARQAAAPAASPPGRDGRRGAVRTPWRRALRGLGVRGRAARAPARARSPAEYLDSLGGLGADVHVAHGTHLSQADRALLRSRGTAVALCARSNAILGAGIPPVAALLREGSPIAVGTDSLASTPDLDLLAEAARPRGRRDRPGLRREATWRPAILHALHRRRRLRDRPARPRRPRSGSDRPRWPTSPSTTSPRATSSRRSCAPDAPNPFATQADSIT